MEPLIKAVSKALIAMEKAKRESAPAIAPLSTRGDLIKPENRGESSELEQKSVVPLEKKEPLQAKDHSSGEPHKDLPYAQSTSAALLPESRTPEQSPAPEALPGMTAESEASETDDIKSRRIGAMQQLFPNISRKPTGALQETAVHPSAPWVPSTSDSPPTLLATTNIRRTAEERLNELDKLSPDGNSASTPSINPLAALKLLDLCMKKWEVSLGERKNLEEVTAAQAESNRLFNALPKSSADMLRSDLEQLNSLTSQFLNER